MASEHGDYNCSDIADAEVGFNNSPTLPVSFVGDDEESHGRGNKQEVIDEDDESDDKNGYDGGKNWPLPVSPVLPSASSSSLSASRPKMKVTMSFMKAYKAMRGPRDIEPSPLFGCLVKPRLQNGGSSMEEEEDDPFKLAGRDEVKLLNDVNDTIIGDGDEDTERRKTRPFARYSSDDEDTGRQTVFYFEQPAISPLIFKENETPEDCSECSGSDDDSTCSITADYTLDHAKMDQGWIKANGPFESDDEGPYVSDDDGDPAEARISPAVFRALAAGCTLNDIDSLRLPFSGTPSLRPLTPQDKILDVSIDTTHRNNVAPYCHRRQFDIHTGEELSPAYRVEPGPSSSILWSPPGLTPERAGLFLLLLQEGQGGQQLPVRGSGMPALFQRMAPLDCQELRAHLYGGTQVEVDDVSATLSPSSTSSSSSSPSSSPLPGSASNDSDGSQKSKRRTMTYTWSEVNEAVQHCRFDPITVSLTAVGINNSHRAVAASTSGSGSGSGQNTTATAIATERALLQTFRDSWRAIQAGQAADARLVAANEEAQVAITAQARCLATVEHQLAACRAAELARECKEAQEHYRLQCQTERRAERQAQKLRRRRKHVVHAINEHLRSLRTTVGETAARLAQGRELQRVLAQRLRDGEARLERLCRDHGVADVAALSNMLADDLAMLGVEEEE